MPTATDPNDPTYTAPTAERPPATEPSAASLWARWGTLIVLVALFVASLGVLGWHFTRGDDDGADSLASNRESAMAAADKFMVTVNTYGPDMLGKDGKTMPSYRSAVEKLLTAKYVTEFDQNVPYAEATVAGNKAGRSAKVFQTGVAAIDEDTADVLVAGQLTVTLPQKGSKKPVVAGREMFRVNVDLVKTHGRWLVDNWGPTEQAPAGSGSAGVAQ